MPLDPEVASEDKMMTSVKDKEIFKLVLEGCEVCMYVRMKLMQTSAESITTPVFTKVFSPNTKIIYYNHNTQVPSSSEALNDVLKKHSFNLKKRKEKGP